MGFRIQYKFTECIKVPTIRNEVGNVSTIINNLTWTKPTFDTTQTESSKETVNTNTERILSTSGMSQSTLIILLSIPEFILVSIMVVAGIVFYRERRSRLSAQTNTAQGTVSNSTEMRNIDSARQNGGSGIDGYETFQPVPSGGYEEVQPATDGYEKVQIRATAQEQESGYKATYANIA
ncbi:uncharacterized protein LOC144424289 [Styela clava]